ncbi:hypothetical protein [Vibrio parahaemolyticus]|uniref:hypothetical protein n=1 Tax=Vibrio parahaemolyticus TaxID=670 RepID=UPI0018A18FDA|nr:hypothetical protein [Vibrio parahaemolyticus]
MIPTASIKLCGDDKNCVIAGCAEPFFCHTTGNHRAYTLDTVERPQKNPDSGYTSAGLTRYARAF